MLVNKGLGGVWWDSGKGKLFCVRPPIRGIEQHLLDLVTAMVDELGFSIVLFSIDTGLHVTGSRHYKGEAVDITDVHTYGREPDPVSLSNPHAVAVVQWCINKGFVAGHENGAYNAVLLGPTGTRWNETDVAHAHHIHMSVYRP